ncbi:TIGR04211 family SH3 domain-containing protein [Saccharospirillum salsuginis]|uniref:SH3b domain-containing protein n=1 Tax=Saccharospirillum salsuginis TaxID=418750 RepID=A0A918KH45_9GAMM|nr:TIGR04211 family SH3 domain-containing protein [Saccharospirillum salsuginis]GGX60664.1 hypothetical protein GCM10007392_30860 [Saccharospirillum salsuginis]
MTRSTFLKPILGLIATALISGSAFSATYWLSDELWVNVRTGAGDQFRILKTIPSGTRMETLEDEPNNGYLHVRTEEGIEGWVPERFLQDEPTSEIRIANVQAERDELQRQLEELDTKYKDLLADKGDVNGELETLRSENARLSDELQSIKQVSENAIQLDQHNQELAQENASLKNDLDLAQSKLSNLQESRESRMLMAGGGLIVLGTILGLLLPRMRSKRRDSWA